VRRYIDDEVRFGQILPGYRADLVIVDGNPLEDVRNARKVSGVFVSGRYASEEQITDIRVSLKNRYRFLRGANDRENSHERREVMPDSSRRLRKAVDATTDNLAYSGCNHRQFYQTARAFELSP
jgi:adenine deaminase